MSVGVARLDRRGARGATTGASRRRPLRRQARRSQSGRHRPAERPRNPPPPWHRHMSMGGRGGHSPTSEDPHCASGGHRRSAAARRLREGRWLQLEQWSTWSSTRTGHTASQSVSVVARAVTTSSTPLRSPARSVSSSRASGPGGDCDFHDEVLLTRPLADRQVVLDGPRHTYRVCDDSPGTGPEAPSGRQKLCRGETVSAAAAPIFLEPPIQGVWVTEGLVPPVWFELTHTDSDAGSFRLRGSAGCNSVFRKDRVRRWRQLAARASVAHPYRVWRPPG